ncbi:murein L,D-transpeptidase catalytic domain family protein [Hymenobacter sp. BT175]|uniref:murein L,D-transpeptidase catalytic domain family protein n=1 Tax=Hymenobacter translucens TaxID=2886507 RepID=UPI001D0E1669|nr:murein L,D-transpeptidase catalytic domain family protein [Hymenobacter translucens]MCC2548360.1 murein L,D-transpeptidase catalytic domain family protein [Hymenobacter translucens]
MEKQSVVTRQRIKRRTRRMARRLLPFVAALFMATPLASPTKSVASSTSVAPTKATPASPGLTSLDQHLYDTYSSMNLEAQGLRFEVFQKAMTGYLNMKQNDLLSAEKELLSVIDFDLPSNEKRLWVLDLATKQVLFNTLVAHGHNTGEKKAKAFSNTNESNMSSLGFYVTTTEYQGKHGRSLKLKGLDEGFNTNAEARAIVMHGAEYVSEDFIRTYGRLGRSLGCPALPMDQHAEIIDTVTDGTCLFVNKSDAGYESKFLDQEVATAALQTQSSPTS